MLAALERRGREVAPLLGGADPEQVLCHAKVVWQLAIGDALPDDVPIILPSSSSQVANIAASAGPRVGHSGARKLVALQRTSPRRTFVHLGMRVPDERTGIYALPQHFYAWARRALISGRFLSRVTLKCGRLLLKACGQVQ
jgi:hypothetical protein